MIARTLLSGEARFGYVPSKQVATYCELMRLQEQLSDDVVRYKIELYPLLVVLFTELMQVFNLLTPNCDRPRKAYTVSREAIHHK